jgi:hypothetical protein
MCSRWWMAVTRSAAAPTMMTLAITETAALMTTAS